MGPSHNHYLHSSLCPTLAGISILFYSAAEPAISGAYFHAGCCLRSITRSIPLPNSYADHTEKLKISFHYVYVKNVICNEFLEIFSVNLFFGKARRRSVLLFECEEQNGEDSFQVKSRHTITSHIIHNTFIYYILFFCQFEYRRNATGWTYSYIYLVNRIAYVWSYHSSYL